MAIDPSASCAVILTSIDVARQQLVELIADLGPGGDLIRAPLFVISNDGSSGKLLQLPNAFDGDGDWVFDPADALGLLSGTAATDGSGDFVFYRTSVPVGSEQTGSEISFDVTLAFDGVTRTFRIQLLLVVAAVTAPTPTPENRVAALQAYQGRQMVEPQQYHADVSGFSASETEHPHIGPYTHVAIRDGDFHDPTVWNTGTVPNGLAPVSIAIQRTGQTVSVGSSIIDVGGFHVTIRQSCSFKDMHVGAAGCIEAKATVGQPNIQIRYDTVLAHGKFITGESLAAHIADSPTGGARINWQCVIQEPPGKTARGGIVMMESARIYGKPKATRTHAGIAAGQVDASLHAGDTAIYIPDLASKGWKDTDRILIVSTADYARSMTDAQYSGPNQFYMDWPEIGLDPISKSRSDLDAWGHALSQDEVRQITLDLPNNRVLLDRPLTFDHIHIRDTLKRGEFVELRPVIGMLTHSIMFCSLDGATAQSTGHLMQMFSDDQQSCFAEARRMGRTQVDPSQIMINGKRAYTNGSKATEVTNDNNMIGRYGWHAHYCSFTNARRRNLWKGLSAWFTDDVAPGGRAYQQHSSNMHVEGCVGFNYRASGLGTENGNEIGQWIDNLMAGFRGDGYEAGRFNERPEFMLKQNGSAGIAYDSQSRAILMQGNIASSANVGFSWFQQTVPIIPLFPRTVSVDLLVPDIFSMRIADPLSWGGGSGNGSPFYETFGQEQAVMPDFAGNWALGCLFAMYVAHRQSTDRTDNTPGVFRNFHTWGCHIPWMIPQYSFNYDPMDCFWGRHTPETPTLDAPSLAMFMGVVSWGFNFVNVKATGFHVGGNYQGGNYINYNGYFIDCDFTGCVTEIQVDSMGRPPVSGAFAGAEFNNPQNHPAYGVMGPWRTLDGQLNPTTYPCIPRWTEQIDTATQLTPVSPKAPFGAGDGIDPSNGAPKPCFVDTSTDKVIVWGVGRNQLVLSGWTCDRIGPRKFGDTQNVESSLAMLIPINARTKSGDEMNLLQRNGCYLDGSTYKMRMFFWDVDRDARGVNKFFVFHIDAELQGFPQEVLDTYLHSSADQWKPTGPIYPEVNADGPIASDQSAPFVYTDREELIQGTDVFSLLLLSNQQHTLWTLGTDAVSAKFRIVTVPNVGKHLQWSGGGSRDAAFAGETTTDYAPTITATNPVSGATTTFTITVSVESIYRETFDIVDQDIATKPGWTGPLGLLVSNGDGTARLAGAGGILTRELGTPYGFLEYIVPTDLSGTQIILAANADGSDFYYLEQYKNSNSVRFSHFYAGEFHDFQFYDIGSLAGTIYRWKIVRLPGDNFDTIELERNGFLYARAGDNMIIAGTRFGIGNVIGPFNPSVGALAIGKL